MGQFLMLARTIRRFGPPLVLYTNRREVFRIPPGPSPSLTEQMTGRHLLTQFDRLR